ncbi:hypothetical protein B0H16DRAFT_1465035 [Mycena metata]|uniref:Uncharacterized protein n=1 Tax=Mycena metata TaxID=1033252 RepID=A0AAD7ICR3_9AGAR|nr:hypothetical protein B0H16DRAFT_1465035 [Mycena metata]
MVIVPKDNRMGATIIVPGRTAHQTTNVVLGRLEQAESTSEARETNPVSGWFLGACSTSGSIMEVLCSKKIGRVDLNTSTTTPPDSYGSPVALEIVEVPRVFGVWRCFDGSLEGSLEESLEESLGWKREVLNVCLRVLGNESNREPGCRLRWPSTWRLECCGRIGEGGRVIEIEVAYPGTAARSMSRVVGERDKGININITRFNTSSGAGAARLPTCRIASFQLCCRGQIV